VTRQRAVLLVAVLIVVVGGAAGAVLAVHSSKSVAAVGSECGTGVPGRGFRVYACESGGAATGHGHPKELLVVRSDGSSVAFHAFRIGRLAVGDGEVVAVHDLDLVRVTSSRLVPLLTEGDLAGALRVRRTAIMDDYVLRVDPRGDIYFVASVLRGVAGRPPGCRNRVLERTTGGALRHIRSLRRDICG
jgi:hypothetical protein